MVQKGVSLKSIGFAFSPGRSTLLVQPLAHVLRAAGNFAWATPPCRQAPPFLGMHLERVYVHVNHTGIVIGYGIWPQS